MQRTTKIDLYARKSGRMEKRMNKRLKTWLFALSLAVLTAAAGGCSKSNQEAGIKQENETKAEIPSQEKTETQQWFTEMDTTDLDGNSVTSELFAGKKLTLINKWATFCGPCINEIPELEKLYQEYEDKGVGIVGLIVDTSSSTWITGVTEEDKELAQEILDKTGAAYPQITVWEGLLATDFVNSGIFPTTYFVDQDGNFVGGPIEGAKDKEGWEEVIKERLAMVEEKE